MNEEHWPEWITSWDHLPVEIRRYLTRRLVERMLFIHDGSKGLIRFLYAGQPRADISPAQTYRMTPDEFWPYVLEDVRAYLAAEQVKKSQAQAQEH